VFLSSPSTRAFSGLLVVVLLGATAFSQWESRRGLAIALIVVAVLRVALLGAELLRRKPSE
jgi:hypothetical protein